MARWWFVVPGVLLIALLIQSRYDDARVLYQGIALTFALGIGLVKQWLDRRPHAARRRAPIVWLANDSERFAFSVIASVALTIAVIAILVRETPGLDAQARLGSFGVGAVVGISTFLSIRAYFAARARDRPPERVPTATVRKP